MRLARADAPAGPVMSAISWPANGCANPPPVRRDRSTAPPTLQHVQAGRDLERDALHHGPGDVGDGRPEVEPDDGAAGARLPAERAGAMERRHDGDAAGAGLATSAASAVSFRPGRGRASGRSPRATRRWRPDVGIESSASASPAMAWARTGDPVVVRAMRRSARPARSRSRSPSRSSHPAPPMPRPSASAARSAAPTTTGVPAGRPSRLAASRRQPADRRRARHDRRQLRRPTARRPRSRRATTSPAPGRRAASATRSTGPSRPRRSGADAGSPSAA